MTQKIFRFVLLGVAAGLMLGGIAGCFGGGEEETEPTPDLQATIDAAVAAATPTETPVPEPTDTPVPPTPDLAATIAAAIAANQPTPVPPTNTPEPTDTPVPPTNTPVPTATPTRAPTATPQPTPTEARQSGPPCVIAGKVTIGGSVPPPGTVVTARSQDNGAEVQRALTNDTGIYNMTITRFNQSFDLFVGTRDSGVDTDVCTRGSIQAKTLNVN